MNLYHTLPVITVTPPTVPSSKLYPYLLVYGLLRLIWIPWMSTSFGSPGVLLAAGSELLGEVCVTMLA